MGAILAVKGAKLPAGKDRFYREFKLEDFVNRIIKARKRRLSLRDPNLQLTANELEKLAGLARGQMSRLENMYRPSCSLETATKICRALRIRMDWACYGDLPMDDLSAFNDDEPTEEASGVREKPKKDGTNS